MSAEIVCLAEARARRQPAPAHPLLIAGRSAAWWTIQMVALASLVGCALTLFAWIG